MRAGDHGAQRFSFASEPTTGNFAMVILIIVASLFFFYAWRDALGLKRFWLCNLLRRLGANNEEQPVNIRVNMQREFCNAQQRYSERGTLVMLVIYTVLSIMVLVQDLMLAGPFLVRQYSGPWYSSWSAMGFGLLLVARWPNLHSVMRIPVSYLLAILVVTSFIMPVAGRSKQDVLVADSVIRVALIVLAPIGGTMTCTLGSAFYSVAAAISFNVAGGSSEVGNLSYGLWQVTLGIGTTLLGSYCIIGHMTNEVKEALKRKEVVAERETVSSLLTIVCDAVVELDDEGQIVSPMLGLSNLLLRGSMMRFSSQAGTRLLDLLHTDEEKKRFEDFMRASENKSAVGNFDLQDSWGKPITMEVVKVVLASSWASSSKYLIGIKEHVDFGGSRAGFRVGGLSTSEEELSAASSSSPSSVGGDMLTASLSKRRTSRRQERFEAGQMPTSQKALEVTLLLLMETWRLGTQGGRFCCSFHAACSKLISSAERIKRMRCNLHFKARDGLQCSKCGIEDPPTSPFCLICEDQCLVCESIQQVFPSLQERGGCRIPSLQEEELSSSFLSEPPGNSSRPPGAQLGPAQAWAAECSNSGRSLVGSPRATGIPQPELPGFSNPSGARRSGATELGSGEQLGSEEVRTSRRSASHPKGQRGSPGMLEATTLSTQQPQTPGDTSGGGDTSSTHPDAAQLGGPEDWTSSASITSLEVRCAKQSRLSGAPPSHRLSI